MRITSTKLSHCLDPVRCPHRSFELQVATGPEADTFLVIQGIVDSTSTVSAEELSETIDFCAKGWTNVQPEQRAAVLQKVASSVPSEPNATADGEAPNEKTQNIMESRESLDPEEERALDYIRARQIMRTEDSLHIGNFSTDAIDGLTPHLERGNLTLLKAMPKADMAAVETSRLTKSVD